jgi:hypothetical protein
MAISWLGERIMGSNDSLSEESLFGQDVWRGDWEYKPEEKVII